VKEYIQLILISSLVGIGNLYSDESWKNSKTWFGDPDLQGTWTNASLTNLERPDFYDTLIVSEKQTDLTFLLLYQLVFH
jgi:hypothetical protein